MENKRNLIRENYEPFHNLYGKRVHGTYWLTDVGTDNIGTYKMHICAWCDSLLSCIFHSAVSFYEVII